MPIGVRQIVSQPATTLSGKRSVVGTAEFSSKGKAPEKQFYKGLSYNDMYLMYLSNVWIRAIVDRIIDRIAEVQPVVRTIQTKLGQKPSRSALEHKGIVEELLANPNTGTESFESLRRSVHKDVLLYDAGSMEIVHAVDGYGETEPAEIWSVAGDMIRVNVDRRGVFKDSNSAYLQVEQSKTVAEFPQDNLMYMKRFPRSSAVYGLSPLESLSQTVTAELYASQHNLDFFANDATPRFAVLFDNLGMGQADPAMRRMRQWWDQELKGKPHRPLLLGTEQGQVRFQQVALSNQDMQFLEYSRWLLGKIMAIYGMQPFVLGVVDIGTGKLNSQQQKEQFKKDALAPALRLFADHFNPKILWSDSGFGYDDVYLDWLAFLAKDELEQAKIDEVYWKMGALTVNMIRQKLGLEEVGWGDAAFIPKGFIPWSEMELQAVLNETKDEDEESEFDEEETEKRLGMADPKKLIGLKGTDDTELTDVIVSLLKRRESALGKLFSFPSQLVG